MGFNYLQAAERLQGDSLLFKLPEIPGTHLRDHERMKSWVDLEAIQSFWTWNIRIGNPANPAPKPLGHLSSSLRGILFGWSLFRKRIDRKDSFS